MRYTVGTLQAFGVCLCHPQRTTVVVCGPEFSCSVPLIFLLLECWLSGSRGWIGVKDWEGRDCMRSWAGRAKLSYVEEQE